MSTHIASPVNARSRRTRAALLAAARELIDSGGFAALTMAAVADRAGVTRRAVYLHFETRAQLVSVLLDHLCAVEDLAGSVARVWAAPDATHALTAWAAHLSDFHRRILPVDLAVAQAADTDPDTARYRDQVAANQQSACRQLAEWLAAEQRLAAPWTTQAAAELLWALMSPELLSRLLGGDRWSPTEYAERIAVLLRRTLTSGPVATAGPATRPAATE